MYAMFMLRIMVLMKDEEVEKDRKKINIHTAPMLHDDPEDKREKSTII